MSKPRLAGFPAALFLAGLGLSLYYADAWWRLPAYSEEDIAASVELNLVMDLRRQDRAVKRTDEEIQTLRSQLDQEIRADIARTRWDAQKGFAAGTAALLISLTQMLWMRRVQKPF